MQDQHFMQQWNTGHDRFSEDCDRVVHKALRLTRRRGGAQEVRSRPAETPLARKARLTGLGVMGGLLVGVGLGTVLPLATSLDCSRAVLESPQPCGEFPLA